MLVQKIWGPKARVRIHHEVAYDYDEKRGIYLRRVEVEDEYVENLLLDAGRIQLHKQCYETSGSGSILTNGFNYIGLSNNSTAPAAGDTSLAGELTGNGISRAQGTVTIPTGSGNQTTIEKVFTFTGVSQSVRKTALFTQAGPPIAGVMAHEVLFTPRSMVTNDNLTISFEITLG